MKEKKPMIPTVTMQALSQHILEKISTMLMMQALNQQFLAIHPLIPWKLQTNHHQIVMIKQMIMETVNVCIIRRVVLVMESYEVKESDCDDQTDDNGDGECMYNSQSGSCYGVVRSQGIRGNGNFDDGYNAAEKAAKAESDELNTIVGVLGGIIGALILVIAGGVYYVYNQGKHQRDHSSMEMIENNERTINVNDEMIVNNVEDVTPMVTKGGDTEP